MWSLVVVVPQVLVEDPLKVASAPDQHPVQALLTYGPHPPLGERARQVAVGEPVAQVGGSRKGWSRSRPRKL